MTSPNEQPQTPPPAWNYSPYPPPSWAYSPYPPAPPQPPRPPRTGRLVAMLAGGVAAVVGVGLAVNATVDATTAGSGSLATGAGAGSAGTGTGRGGAGAGNGGATQPRHPRPQTMSSGLATPAQQVGVVDIDTVLGYQGGEAAGTGMVITSSGDVLTNNHVVDGATQIRVTVVSTGASYTGTVVGTDPTDDVAVIHLQGAHGLKTIRTSTSGVSVGDTVTGVGNAGGVGGTPSAATGTVVATGQTITASDENGGNAETLHDLIETNAPIQPGDSGGPLYNADDKVVGMDTAASSTGRFSATGDGYAIPIGNAMSVAKKIESGQASSTIHLGYPAFLGVQVQDTGIGGTGGTGGAAVAGVVPGGPADSAGISAGDVITALDGHAIGSADDLSSTLRNDYKPGQQVSVTVTGATGQQQTVTVTLATGPAD